MSTHLRLQNFAVTPIPLKAVQPQPLGFSSQRPRPKSPYDSLHPLMAAMGIMQAGGSGLEEIVPVPPSVSAAPRQNQNAPAQGPFAALATPSADTQNLLQAAMRIVDQVHLLNGFFKTKIQPHQLASALKPSSRTGPMVGPKPVETNIMSDLFSNDGLSDPSELLIARVHPRENPIQSGELYATYNKFRQALVEFPTLRRVAEANANQVGWFDQVKYVMAKLQREQRALAQQQEGMEELGLHHLPVAAMKDPMSRPLSQVVGLLEELVGKISPSLQHDVNDLDVMMELRNSPNPPIEAMDDGPLQLTYPPALKKPTPLP